MGNVVMQKMSQGFHYLKSKVQGFLEGFNAKLVQFKRFVVEKTGKLLQILGKIFKYIVSKLIQMWNFVKTKFEMVFGSMNELRFRLVQLKEFMELAMTCRLMLWFLLVGSANLAGFGAPLSGFGAPLLGLWVPLLGFVAILLLGLVGWCLYFVSKKMLGTAKGMCMEF